MNKKYELTDESIEFCGRRLYRIRSLRAFSSVRKGDLGGFIQSEKNLSHYGDCWVFNDGMVFDDGEVCDNGKIFGRGTVFGRGLVRGNGRISGGSIVCDSGVVCEEGEVRDCAVVEGNCVVCGKAVIRGDSIVKHVSDYTIFKDNWSGRSFFTWTKSNNMWSVEFFHGTGEELIRKGYEESDAFGKNYERYVKFVEENLLN